MTIAELVERYGSPANIPNNELYEFLCRPETKADLQRLIRFYDKPVLSDDSPQALKSILNPALSSLRKRFLSDNSFTSLMSDKEYRGFLMLLFPDLTVIAGSSRIIQ